MTRAADLRGETTLIFTKLKKSIKTIEKPINTAGKIAVPMIYERK